MASVQQARNQAQFSDKEKASIGQAMKEAKSLANSNSIKAASQQHQLAVVVGSMKNEQQRGIMLYKKNDYKGKYLHNCTPPEKMGAKDSGSFVHEGAYSQGDLPVVVGSKGAIIYGHFDKLPFALGYVLAWDNPDDATAAKKVYVTAGRREEILAMSWNEIEQNLNASGSESRFPNMGPALACAKIEDLGHKLASLGATFYGIETPSSS